MTKTYNTGKNDAGKNHLGLVLGGFAGALEAVGLVGTYGATIYSDNNWKSVGDGVGRHTDALLRHQLSKMGVVELLDNLYKDCGLWYYDYNLMV